ncbi:MAG: arginase family protein [Acidobacteriota bacterium]
MVPTAALGRLDSASYLFDRAGLTSGTAVAVSRRVSPEQATLIERCAGFEAAPFSGWLERFSDDKSQRFLGELRDQGWLQPVADSLGPVGSARRQRFFEAVELRRSFRSRRLFHLPDDVGDDEADVCVVGVPVAADGVSAGAALGPAALRQASLAKGFWFDIQAEGVFSEVRCAGGRPEILCQGVRLRDAGDLGREAVRVADLLGEIDRFCARWDGRPGWRPLFLGGDHAVTFPIVHALARRHRDLCLIHFDAHNDLFLKQHPTFSHAAFLQNLHLYSGLRRSVSFGLRNHSDLRTARVAALEAAGVLDRAHLYGLAATRRLLSDPARLVRAVREHVDHSPCYLSIDIDVVSATELAGATSTPAGAGLEWHELLAAVMALCEAFPIVGADLVETRPSVHPADNDPRKQLLALTLALIDGLAKAPEGVAVTEGGASFQT